MSYAVTVATVVPVVDGIVEEPASCKAAALGSRKVLDTASGMVSVWSVYEREALTPGACFDGPAIVAEAETSTLISPGWTGRITAAGYIELRRETA
jgi:N-methylhydantoinase A